WRKDRQNRTCVSLLCSLKNQGGMKRRRLDRADASWGDPDEPDQVPALLFALTASDSAFCHSVRYAATIFSNEKFSTMCCRHAACRAAQTAGRIVRSSIAAAMASASSTGLRCGTSQPAAPTMMA